jgi:hypothetical protein
MKGTGSIPVDEYQGFVRVDALIKKSGLQEMEAVHSSRDVAPVSIKSVALVDVWATALRYNFRGASTNRSQGNVTTPEEKGYFDDYSEFWVEERPAPPEPDPPPDDPSDSDPESIHAGIIRQGNAEHSEVRDFSRKVTGRASLQSELPDMGLWSEEQWNEITPTWAEMNPAPPDDPPPDGPPDDDPEANASSHQTFLYSMKTKSNSNAEHEEPDKGRFELLIMRIHAGRSDS